MNKKILSAMLSVAMLFAAGSAFVSCKDYDDDIKNLQGQIDNLSKAVQDIQAQIQKGYLLTDVSPITGGIKVTLSDGRSWDIVNGKDGAAGKDGDVWTIGDDGFWYKNGAVTPYKAIGTDGKDGQNGKDGVDGKDGKDGADGKDGKDGKDGGAAGVYYVPNADGYFYLVDPNTGTTTKTDIKWSNGGGTGNPVVDAAWNTDNNTLTLTGLVNSNGEVTSVTISLSGTLKSLVFIPHFYLDGIETIDYPWLGDSILVKEVPNAGYTQTTHHKKNIKNTPTMFNYLPDELSENPKAKAQSKAYIFGQTISVDYEINPSNSILSYDENKPSFNVLEPNVVYANTRAAAKTLNVTSPKTWGLFTEDAEVFDIKNSRSTGVHDGAGNSNVNYLQVGLKIEKPNYLEPYPTSGWSSKNDTNGGYLPGTLDASYKMPWEASAKAWYNWYKNDTGTHKDTDNTIALQLHNIDGADVTSDYALLLPYRLTLEGLVWQTTKHTESPMYKEPGFGPEAAVTGDEKGWYTNEKIFVWDSPKEALDNQIGAALELPIYDSYIDLKEYIGIRVLKEDVIRRTVSGTNWNASDHVSNVVDPLNVKKYYGDEEFYGLHYEFQLVDYETDTNVTHDSRYATFTDTEVEAAKNATISYTGRVRALTVNEIAVTEAETWGSKTAIDREPLVRVMVKNADGDVLLDGYILIHITNTNDNLQIKTYQFDTKTTDICNGVVFTTNWAQFSRLILEQGMGQYQKNKFDYFYWADCIDKGAAVDAADAPFVTANALQLPAYDGHKTYSMRIFNFGSDIYGNTGEPTLKGNNNAKEETSNAFEDKALGVVRYYPNADGQTNHKFDWYLTADEVEYLTHGKAAGEEVTVTRWIRFKAKTYEEANKNIPDGIVKYTQDDYNAEWPFVWVKLTVTLKRAAGKVAEYDKKIDNYWYNWKTGADNGWSGYLVDIEAPRDGFTIKDKNWFGIISNTLFTNVPQSINKGWYYFAPKTYEITGISGRKYTITTQRSGKIGTNEADASATPSAADPLWNNMFNRYIQKGNTFEKTPGTAALSAEYVATVKPSESYKWAEATLKADMEKYAINSNAGVFENDILYAYDQTSKTYYQIAKIIKQQYTKGDPQATNAGEIQLFHWLTAEDGIVGSATQTAFENWVCYDVVNAIGYKVNNANINEELRSWLGFIGQQCNNDVAYYVGQKQYDDDNVATVMNSWKRPINLPNNNPDDALDAKTNENTVYIVDNLKMFDWRGDKPATDGYMYDNHYWFWAYYNIKGIAINLDGSKVMVDLNDGNGFVKLNTVTSQLRLRGLTAGTVSTIAPANTARTLFGKLSGATYWDYEPYNLIQYNRADKEKNIEQELGIYPANVANKAKFGGFYYENNSSTLTKFTLKFPVAIRYEWGWVFDSELTWKVDTTHGND